MPLDALQIQALLALKERARDATIYHLPIFGHHGIIMQRPNYVVGETFIVPGPGKPYIDKGSGFQRAAPDPLSHLSGRQRKVQRRLHKAKVKRIMASLQN